MHKDLSGKKDWAKHTGNAYGGRRKINKANRKNAKRAIEQEKMEGKSKLAGIEIHR